MSASKIAGKGDMASANIFKKNQRRLKKWPKKKMTGGLMRDYRNGKIGKKISRCWNCKITKKDRRRPKKKKKKPGNLLQGKNLPQSPL